MRISFSIIVLALVVFSCKNEKEKTGNDISNTTTEAPVEETPSIKKDFIKTFEGNVNGEYEIIMKLTSNNGEISGAYFYKSKGLEIELQGELSNDGSVKLNEFDSNGNQTGVFKGSLVSESKIEGNWSKPNGDNIMSFLLIETNTAYDPKPVEPKFEIREGKHNFTLQWIGWDNPGSVTITKSESGLYTVSGEQAANNEYAKISGTLKPLSETMLEFEGIITTKTSMTNGGEVCERNGMQIFEAPAGKKYWRLQNKINCEGGMVTDYIDIYF